MNEWWSRLCPRCSEKTHTVCFSFNIIYYIHFYFYLYIYIKNVFEFVGVFLKGTWWSSWPNLHPSISPFQFNACFRSNQQALLPASTRCCGCASERSVAIGGDVCGVRSGFVFGWGVCSHAIGMGSYNCVNIHICIFLVHAVGASCRLSSSCCACVVCECQFEFLKVQIFLLWWGAVMYNYYIFLSFFLLFFFLKKKIWLSENNNLLQNIIY